MLYWPQFHATQGTISASIKNACYAKIRRTSILSIPVHLMACGTGIWKIQPTNGCVCNSGMPSATLRNKELASTNAELKNFAYSTSHDIKGPSKPW